MPDGVVEHTDYGAFGTSAVSDASACHAIIAWRAQSITRPRR